MDLHREAELLLSTVESFWPGDTLGTERLKTKRLIELLEEFAERFPKHSREHTQMRLRAKLLKRKLQATLVRIQ